MKTKYFLIGIASAALYISPLFCRKLTGPEIGSLRDQFNREFVQPREQGIINEETISQAQNIIEKLKQGKVTKIAAELEAKLYKTIFDATREQLIPERRIMKEENKNLKNELQRSLNEIERVSQEAQQRNEILAQQSRKLNAHLKSAKEKEIELLNRKETLERQMESVNKESDLLRKQLKEERGKVTNLEDEINRLQAKNP